jgi:hypothetical protein
MDITEQDQVNYFRYSNHQVDDAIVWFKLSDFNDFIY